MSGLRVGVPSQVAPLLGLTYETGRWQLLAALQPAWSPPIPYAGGQLSMTDLQLSLGAGLTLTQAESWSLGPALQLTGGASGWWWKGGAPSATAWSPLLTLQPGVGLGLGERVGVKAGLDIALVRGGVIEKGEEVIGQSTLHATVGAETYFW